MAETTRSEKLKRLVAVQRHLERMTENELADTTRKRNEVQQSMQNVIEAIGSVDPVHQALSRHYADRYGRLTVKDNQLSGMQQLLEMQVLKERTKADRLEANMKEAREEEDREAADEAIYDIVDQAFAAGTPASSKVQKP